MKKRLTLRDFIAKPKKSQRSKIRKSYYSVYFNDGDPNYESDVMVSEHENNIDLDEDDCHELENHFATKREANAARKQIIKILKLGK